MNLVCLTFAASIFGISAGVGAIVIVGLAFDFVRMAAQARIRRREFVSWDTERAGSGLVVAPWDAGGDNSNQANS